MAKTKQEQKQKPEISKVYTRGDIESLNEGDLIRRRNGEIFYIDEVKRHYKYGEFSALILAKRLKRGIKIYKATPENMTPRNGDVSLNLLNVGTYRKGSESEYEQRRYNSLDNRLKECGL